MADDTWPAWTIDQIKAESGRAIAIGPFGSRMKSELYTPTGVPVIRGNNISDTRSFTGDFVFVSTETADRLASCNVFPGDLVFPHRGAIGLVGIVPTSESQRYVLSTSMMKLSCNTRLVDPVFLFYFFRSDLGRHELLKNASTVGTPGIGQPLASLRSISLRLPSLQIQHAIAHILGTLDDKIELNRRMNETLEAMARALFKSWFVDFDPVRAKAEGLEVFDDTELRSLFPEALDADNRPIGWPLRSLIDLCELKRGYDLPAAQRVDGSCPIVSSSGISGFHSTPMAQGPGVVTGRYGTIGQVYFINEAYWPLNTALYVRDFKGNCPRFVYYALQHIDFLQYSDKAAVPGINRNHLHQAPMVVPPRPVQQAFEILLTPVWAKQEANKSESATLTALRDTLLPKLISGELRAKAAEKIIEAVA